MRELILIIILMNGNYNVNFSFLSEIYKMMILSLQASLLMICQDYRKMVDNYVAELVGNNIKTIYD